MNDPKLINPDNREEIPQAIKRTGFEVQQLSYQYYNDIVFKNTTDHVWGTSSQVTNNDATFYTDASGNPLDKNASAVTIDNDDKILIAHDATLSADLMLSTTSERLKIEMLKGATLDLGDAGGGVPYLFQLDINNARLCDIYTTEDYEDLSTLTDEQQRVVKNRGYGNKINLNGRQIFSGGRPYEFYYPVNISDPYIISQNGFSYEGFKVSGSNDDVCLFADWWKAWGGLDIVGDGSILVPPAFNPATGVLQRNVFTDDPSGRFMRLNTPFSGSTGVDSDVHSRTSPVTLATITTFTSSASVEISGITDADILKFKIGARVQASGIPGGTTNTTIISSIIHNGTNDNSIFLIDSETGNSVSVTATGTITVDMSGNSKISQQLDQMQGHRHAVLKTGRWPTGAGISLENTSSVTSSSTIASGSGSSLTTDNDTGDPGDDGTNDAARSGPQTQGINNQRQSYLML